MFNKFENDKVKLLKKDGDILENIPASVQAKIILISDASVPIEAGDKLSRQLPSGMEEVFVITDPGYSAGVGSIKPHYQIKFKREDSYSEETSKPNTVVYNVSGQNSRVNINSHDQSTNQIYNASEQLFDEIRSVIEKEVAIESERNALLELTNQMQDNQGTPNFLDSYKEFMSTAANHVTFIAPFLPALAGLLI